MNRLDAHTVLCAALGEAMAGRDPSNALLEAERGRVMAHTQLPADMGKDRRFFEEMGIAFGAVRGIFIDATLPGGWTRVRYGDNGYGWRILDEKGRPRIDIFHKPAFYDERAYMLALRRYDVEPNCYDDDDDDKFAGARVTRDKKDVIWETERLPICTQSDKYGEGNGPSLREAMHEKAIAWLDKHGAPPAPVPLPNQAGVGGDVEIAVGEAGPGEDDRGIGAHLIPAAFLAVPAGLAGVLQHEPRRSHDEDRLIRAAASDGVPLLVRVAGKLVSLAPFAIPAHHDAALSDEPHVTRTAAPDGTEGRIGVDHEAPVARPLPVEQGSPASKPHAALRVRPHGAEALVTGRQRGGVPRAPIPAVDALIAHGPCLRGAHDGHAAQGSARRACRLGGLVEIPREVQDAAPLTDGDYKTSDPRDCVERRIRHNALNSAGDYPTGRARSQSGLPPLLAPLCLRGCPESGAFAMVSYLRIAGKLPQGSDRRGASDEKLGAVLGQGELSSVKARPRTIPELRTTGGGR